MKAKYLLIILILIVVLVVVLFPLFEDIPAFKGVTFPNITFGLGSIGEELSKIIEGISKSIKF